MADLYIDAYGIRWPLELLAIETEMGLRWGIDLAPDIVTFSPDVTEEDFRDVHDQHGGMPWPACAVAPRAVVDPLTVDFLWEENGDDIREDADREIRRRGGYERVLRESVDHG